MKSKILLSLAVLTLVFASLSLLKENNSATSGIDTLIDEVEPRDYQRNVNIGTFQQWETEFHIQRETHINGIKIKYDACYNGTKEEAIQYFPAMKYIGESDHVWINGRKEQGEQICNHFFIRFE